MRQSEYSANVALERAKTARLYKQAYRAASEQSEPSKASLVVYGVLAFPVVFFSFVALINFLSVRIA